MMGGSIQSQYEGFTKPASVGIQIVYFRSAFFLEDLIKSIFNLDFDENQIQVAFFINQAKNYEKNLISSLWEKYQVDWGEKIYLFIKESYENIGFGRAHNYLAFNYNKDKEFILMLNPDTHLFYDSLKRAIIKMSSDMRIGVIEFMQFPWEHPKEYDDITLETAWSSGACVLYRNKLFQKIGGFDENIFLYCEDVDLGWRIWLSNYRCILYPLSKCIHYVADLNKIQKKEDMIFWSMVSGAYIRWKYFDQNCVQEYFNKISQRHSEEIIALVQKEFHKIINNINPEQLKSFNDLKVKAKNSKYIKVYDDTNYAIHRPLMW